MTNAREKAEQIADRIFDDHLGTSWRLREHYIQASAAVATTFEEQEKEIERLDKLLREAIGVLGQISHHPAVSYEYTSRGNYEGQYGIGVTDGHRLCAALSREFLSKPEIKERLGGGQ